MPPKKRGRPSKKDKDLDTAPLVDNDGASPPPAKKPKAEEGVDGLFSQSPIKKQTKDAQVARDKSLAVPVDEGCPLASTHRVYIDDDGSIYDASLNQTNVDGNNNKFYRIQILEARTGGNFQTWTRWGRVGERGQTKILPGGSFDEALRDFEKKFKDKSGHKWEDRHAAPKPKKYTFIERSYESDSPSEDEEAPPAGDGARRGSKASIHEPPESKLQEPVQKLMQLIFNMDYFAETMADMNYDVKKLPLGKLSKLTLEKGYEQLKALAAIILADDPAPGEFAVDQQRKKEMSNAYYSLIPHNFGRDRPVPITSEQQLKREIEMLDSLSDMKIAEDIIKEAKGKKGAVAEVHPVDRQYAGLGMEEMTPLEHDSKEFKELESYLQGTRGATHSIRYEVEDIFRIERAGEYGRFDESSFGKMAADRRLLWHGSRATNFGGILSQGLRIAPPEAPVSGYMFGKGVYLADMSSKSANYCYHQASGNNGLLLLCEAELGKPMLELTNADYNAGERAAKQGSYTTWGKGRTGPKKWKAATAVNKALKGVRMPDVSTAPGPTNVAGAYLEYNEFIAYDVNQIRMRYLFRVKMGYGF